MNKESASKFIKLIAEIAAESLKKLASEDRDLSAETLIDILKSRKEIKGFITETKARSEKINALETKNKQTQAQKDKLLKQLQEAENRSRKADTFFRKALSAFINLLSTKGKSKLQSSLSQFKVLLQNETNFELLSDALQNLKNIAVRDGIEEDKPDEKRKSSSFFGKLLKSSESEDTDVNTFQTVFIKHLKTAYQDILDELSLHLGEDYLEKLSQVSKHIRKSFIIDDFLKIRTEIILLVSEYINDVSSERELAAEFIKEIGKRLIELENFILESLALTSNHDHTNQEFNEVLDKQLSDLRNSVNFSKTLTELKDAVVSRLDAINQALENKRKKDTDHRDNTDKKMATLQQHLSEMKEKISTANEQSKILEQELLCDPLTGAYNRRAYDRRINDEMNRYLRYKRPFSLLLLDVDHFKKINDNYGHAIGDKCLKEIIKRIKPALRETDFLARYGGEEFIVILPETKNSIAKDAAERLRKIVENIEFLHKNKNVNITISIGVTQAIGSDESHEPVFIRTDQALYEAKNSGRNRVVLK